MKKNNMMRIASVLLVAVLLTSCVIAGTFAKYTTSVNSADKARVAYWGFQSTNSMDITDLFKGVYSTDVDAVDADDVIAPGTAGFDTFAFAWDEDTTAWDGAAVAVTGPEVDYTFTVAVDATCDALIKANPNIKWALVAGNAAPADDSAEWGSFDDMVTEIKNLSGSTDGSGVKTYEANTLPEKFTDADETYTIAWKWDFETADDNTTNDKNEMALQDATDTAMGNAQLLDDVSISISITATQINA